MININFFRKRNNIKDESKNKKNLKERKMKNSNVRGSIADMVSFIKEKTIENIVDCRNTNQVELSEEDLRKIVNIIDASVTQAFTASIGTIEKSLTS